MTADFVKEIAEYGAKNMVSEDLVRALLGAMDEEQAKAVADAAKNKGNLTLELLQHAGLRKNQAALLLAGIELGRRCYYSKVASSPQDIFNAVGYIGFQEEENVLLVTMNGANEIVGVHLMTKGIINRALFSSREILRQTLKDNAKRIAVAHNHPSGNLEPSPEDREITQKLQNACALLDITLLDHLVVGKGRYISMLERGIIRQQGGIR